jgi:hypothetical protein
VIDDRKQVFANTDSWECCMNPVKAAAWNFWYALSNAETIAVYRFAIAKTWELLKRAAQLALLLLLFGVTILIWFWSLGFHSGRAIRQWFDKDNPTDQEVVLAARDLFLKSLNLAWTWIKAQVKQQFGIEIKLPPLPNCIPLESTQEQDSSTVVEKK